jgi:cytochrome c biogenesis protein CcdA
MTTFYVLGFGAGFLSLLAPCVLPLLPIVISGATNQSRLGSVFLALGLSLSFGVLGVLTALFSNIFDVDSIQKLGAILLMLMGAYYLVPMFSEKMEPMFNFFSTKGSQWQLKLRQDSISSQFFVGSILAMVWAPCSGPTLGMAFGLATQAQNAHHAAIIFLLFGMGAGLGLLLLGFGVQSSKKLKFLLIKNSSLVQKTMGLISLILGFLILTGSIVWLEEFLLNISPDILIEWSTKL